MITLGRGREMSQAEPKLRATIFPTHLLITHIIGAFWGQSQDTKCSIEFAGKAPVMLNGPVFPSGGVDVLSVPLSLSENLEHDGGTLHICYREPVNAESGAQKGAWGADQVPLSLQLDKQLC